MLVTENEVRRIAVIGAGTMGAGVAQVAAAAGYDVLLVDVNDAAVGRGRERIVRGLESGVTRGKLTPEARDAALARVGTAIDLGAVHNADLIIEAVPEDLALKRSTFAAIDAAASERALLASNTSSLPIGAIADAVRNPARLVGMHFFNPVPAMKLVEIVRHSSSAADAVALATAVAVKLGKQPIVVADSPGFATSRLGVLLGLEAIRMVEAGVASAADIDQAMRLGYGHPMGPLELGDLVGLDVRLGIAEHLERALGPSFTPPALLRTMVADGKLGQKSGVGFYVWRDGKKVA